MILTPLLLTLLQQPTPAPLLPVRPRDPFVFRCVLDKRPRIVIAALADDLWVAWDTQSAGLFKAWNGGVRFDGAVYTTVHGPQPTSRGHVYTTGTDGPAWTAYVNGKPTPAHASYVGYILEYGRVVLEWKITFGDKREVLVRERPECVRPREWMNATTLEDAGLEDGAQPTLQREFQAIGLLEGEQINLTMRTDSVAAKLASALERERFEDQKDEKGVVIATRVWSQMPLTSQRPRNTVALVFKPVDAPEQPQERR
ncbi:MAG: hypothetical protein JNL28_15980 [Planctomycetes bacterium]|nr:hypothetical protein [Planctomycetota bacterium]